MRRGFRQLRQRLDELLFSVVRIPGSHPEAIPAVTWVLLLETVKVETCGQVGATHPPSRGRFGETRASPHHLLAIADVFVFDAGLFVELIDVRFAVELVAPPAVIRHRRRLGGRLLAPGLVGFRQLLALLSSGSSSRDRFAILISHVFPPAPLGVWRRSIVCKTRARAHAGWPNDGMARHSYMWRATTHREGRLYHRKCDARSCRHA